MLVTEVERRGGYRRALEEHGIPYDPDLVVEHVDQRDSAAAAVAQLQSLADPPTAVFTSNARTSMPVTAAVRETGLAMVGFGDFPMADMLTPSLTVMDQNPARIGHLAARRIFDRLGSPTIEFPLHTVLDVPLIERESSWPPAG